MPDVLPDADAVIVGLEEIEDDRDAETVSDALAERVTGIDVRGVLDCRDVAEVDPDVVVLREATTDEVGELDTRDDKVAFGVRESVFVVVVVTVLDRVADDVRVVVIDFVDVDVAAVVIVDAIAALAILRERAATLATGEGRSEEEGAAGCASDQPILCLIDAKRPSAYVTAVEAASPIRSIDVNTFAASASSKNASRALARRGREERYEAPTPWPSNAAKTNNKTAK